MHRYAVGQRGSDAVAHLDMVAIDQNLAVRAEFDASERTVSTAAVILADAGDAGTDQDLAVLQAGFFFRTLPPDRMHFELVQDLGRTHRDNVPVAHHGPAILLQRIAPPELDRIER